jgi:hypothetical protein
MKLNVQTDQAWGNLIMTEGDDLWKDRLFRGGSLVTCLANIIQDISDHTFTPEDMNNLLKINNGYKALLTKNCLIDEASDIVWCVVEKIMLDLKLEIQINNWKKVDEYEHKRSHYYIAKIKHLVTGEDHFINVLMRKRYFYCFNVENGKVETYSPRDILYLHEIINEDRLS